MASCFQEISCPAEAHLAARAGYLTIWGDHGRMRNGRRATRCALAIWQDMDKEWTLDIIIARRFQGHVHLHPAQWQRRLQLERRQGPMQRAIGLGATKNEGDNFVWKNMTDKRDEDIFAHLPWGLQCQPPRPTSTAGTWRNSTTGRWYRRDYIWMPSSWSCAGVDWLQVPETCARDHRPVIARTWRTSLGSPRTGRRAGARRQVPRESEGRSAARTILSLATTGDAKERLDTWSQVLMGNTSAALATSDAEEARRGEGEADAASRSAIAWLASDPAEAGQDILIRIRLALAARGFRLVSRGPSRQSASDAGNRGSARERERRGCTVL